MKKIFISISVIILVLFLVYMIYKNRKQEVQFKPDIRFENYLNTYVSISFFNEIILTDAYNGKTIKIAEGEKIGGYLRLTPLEGQTLKQYMIQANYGGVSSGYYNVEISKIQSVTVVSN